ncbi:YbaK/EbsC family protein [Caloramator proteoclasticus]|uniref:Cys-tRNA(Pro) deacylase, prolyl-tRNA editing enzyme YbaK/EbsC n=1 Tax=Caloramator proteoclasticus DSM 10124 TaxID=1121262 RepID=A0A1M4UZ66_9CLOT|nr:YbaK/EbsC family protein [Caloramator proteoclasticus]SHE61959.1 Cys-tRNA(Pro) deacylase, prolyl-tRNA editing enzyme YbaK/EbsC [Caloramator proteoclasticus DSM 10124]
MAIERVREYFRKYNRDKDIMELDASSATVELAAQALDVEPARIAKSLALKNGERVIMIVTAGDAKIDNAKFKAEFGTKPKMLSIEETFEYTGHQVGGVCPFALKNDIPVYLDISLKRFKTVFPACGSSNSAIELTCDELNYYSLNQKWVDVCKNWE